MTAGGAGRDQAAGAELVSRDKVEVLAGFGLTPLALATAPVATQAKVPMIVMAAATSIIPQKSPFIVRSGFTVPQITQPIAEWAPKNKIRTVATLVSDYGPGMDAEKTLWPALPRAAARSSNRCGCRCAIWTMRHSWRG
jgi:ABC-type branched-subunit amino acid transport system substrate-binding protein